MAPQSRTRPHGPVSPSPRVSWREWRTFFFSLLRPYRLQLVLVSLTMVLDALLTILRPWPLKVVIDRVIRDKHTRIPLISHWLNHLQVDRLEILYGACGATLAIAIGTGLCTFYYTRTLGIVGENYTFDLRRRLFAHMQRLSLRFHDHQRIGDLTTRLSSDINVIDDIITDFVQIVVFNACLLFGMLAMLLWLNWKFAIVTLSVAPLLFLAILLFRWKIRDAARAARVSDGLVTSVAQETLSSVRVVQGLAREDHQDERFEAQSRVSLKARLEIKRLQSLSAPISDFLAAVGLALVMWYGATRVIAEELSIGDVLVFFAYVTNLYAPMRALARGTGKFFRAQTGAERVAEILRHTQEVADLPDARPVSRPRGEIEFQNVSFAYEPGRPVLAGIQLRIEPGEKLAIVGTTGAGKSTLVSLVPRLYDATSGTVRIDGEDVRRFTVQSLREQVSLVLQDSLLFKGTIRDNIAFGRPDASEDQILAAAETARATEFIRRLPEGFDTMVSERGTTLSGGQKQRIAIARAILRDSPILILDEPTTGLDVASERAVLEALEEAARGRTALIIAHRLISVRLADRIIVLDRGSIVEEGTHAELLARNGRYAHLHHLHFQTDSLVEQPGGTVAGGP
jgi:subfamily B ATP-binding cassette protein MsbA